MNVPLNYITFDPYNPGLDQWCRDNGIEPWKKENFEARKQRARETGNCPGRVFCGTECIKCVS